MNPNKPTKQHQPSRDIRAGQACFDFSPTWVHSGGKGAWPGLLIFLAFALLAGSPVIAASPAWNFQPRKVGNALVDGGWSLDFPLGEINASPEFSFPLQLVYLSNRESR